MLRHLTSGLIALCTTASALAAQGSIAVSVRVELVPGSGTCSAAAASNTLSVRCTATLAGLPGSFILPGLAGEPAAPARYAGSINQILGSAEPLAIFARGAQVSSWREVSQDNGSYVELTIGW